LTVNRPFCGTCCCDPMMTKPVTDPQEACADDAAIMRSATRVERTNSLGARCPVVLPMLPPAQLSGGARSHAPDPFQASMARARAGHRRGSTVQHIPLTYLSRQMKMMRG